MRSLTRSFLAAVTALGLSLGGQAAAHAELVAVDPAANSTVTTAPAGVTLSFSEQIEVGFSIFKVYRLGAVVSLTQDDEWSRLNELGGALVSEVLTARDDEGAEARADTGMTGGAARSTEVVLGLKGDLAPGVYVVMWRVLSIDAHSTQGFALFAYHPAGD